MHLESRKAMNVASGLSYGRQHQKGFSSSLQQLHDVGLMSYILVCRQID